MNNTLSIFERATRDKLRFPTTVGNLSVEDIWELPLTSNNGLSLDNIARLVNSELKRIGDDSFVETIYNPTQAKLELQLDILKRVIEVKIELRKRAERDVQNAQRKQRLLTALATKQDAALAEMSEDDLRKAIEDIDKAGE